MAAEEQLFADAAVYGIEDLFGVWGIDFRDDAFAESADEIPVAATEFIVCVSDEEQQVAGALEVHCHGKFDIGCLAEGCDQECRGDSSRSSHSGRIFKAEFVIEAVFSTDEWGAVADSDISAAECCADECSECFGAFCVAPAEIIEDGDSAGIGTDGDAIANGFINGGSGHPVGIEVSQLWIDAAGDHKSA